MKPELAETSGGAGHFRSRVNGTNRAAAAAGAMPAGPGLMTKTAAAAAVAVGVCEAQCHDRVRCRSAQDLVPGEGRGRQTFPSGA